MGSSFLSGYPARRTTHRPTGAQGMNRGSRDLAPNSKMALALMRDLFGLDTVTAFKVARVPVRCINSAGGYQFFTPTAVETNRKYADFGAVTLEGVGHYPMLEKPDKFNRSLWDVPKEFATKNWSPSRPARRGAELNANLHFCPQLHSYIPNHPDKSKDLQLSRRELAVVAIVMLGTAIMYCGLTAFQHAAIVPQIGAEL
jgi:hypothetical protein